jgi:hypothetical protein
LEFACKATAPYSGRIIVCSKMSGKHPALNYTAPPYTRPEVLDSHRALEKRFIKQIHEGRMSISFFLFASEHIVRLWP